MASHYNGGIAVRGEFVGHFEQLEREVVDGSVRLFQVVGVPRSVSTGFARALGEAGLYIHEPVNRAQPTLDSAAAFILDELGRAPHTKSEPLTVVVKNMARNLSPSTLRALADLSEGTAWVVRRPDIQMRSLIQVICSEFRGSAVLFEDLEAAEIAAACNYLADAGSSPNGPERFSRTGWAVIGRQFRTVASTDERSVVIDGGELTLAPEDVLRGACERLGMRFVPHMVGGWKGALINANPDLGEASPWIQTARDSLGIMAVAHTAIDVSSLPNALQDHLAHVAVPTYQHMIALPR